MLWLQLITLLQLPLLIFLVVSARRIRFGDPDEPRNRFPNDSCVTPDDRMGRCVRRTTCQSLRRITNLNRLQPYICGFVRKELMVCCSLKSNGQRVFLTTTNPPRSHPPKRTTPRRRRKKPTKPRRILETTTESLWQTPPPLRIMTTSPKIPGVSHHDRHNKDVDNKPPFLPNNCGMTFFTNNRVVGGQVAEKGGWPWMAVVFWKTNNNRPGSLQCGGSLVTDRHVITAAHCLLEGSGKTFAIPNQLIVKLGAHDLRKKNETESVDSLVEDFVLHEHFNHENFTNDIAVLRLIKQIQFTPYISPVCLPYDSLRNEDLTGKTVTVVGFGSRFQGGPASPVLIETSFAIWDQEMCHIAYENVSYNLKGDKFDISDVQMCAGPADGSRDTCQGDSGSPLVAIGKEARFYVVGIVSAGYGCAKAGFPGIYTRVDKFLDWLAIHLAK